MVVGVNNLVAKRALGEVGPLRDVENVFNWGLKDGSSSGRPQFAKNSKETRLAAAVGSSDEEVHAR